jgi:D-alanyl-D-alanine carboxypeptidase (penicillin-binding protein 5/6)
MTTTSFGGRLISEPVPSSVRNGYEPARRANVLLRRLAACLAAALVVPAAAPAQAQLFETKAAHAILIDYESGTVLFQRDADSPMPPASLAKLMTMAVVFNAIREGRLKLTDEFVVSENAWRKGGANSGGSTMFAKVGSSIALSDLMHGVIVQSGNDASIAIAEGMSGTEEAFARRMNLEATRIGLKNSTFRNATGLPDPEQLVTARDLATLAAYIIRQYPEFYAIYSEPEFTWGGITQKNRNPLLAMNIGADGMKTGFTEASGYGLVGSAVRDGRRMIVVVNGTRSEKERGEEARKLLEWGFRSFRKVPLFGPEDIIAEADVFGGVSATVGLRSRGPIEVLLPEAAPEEVSAKVVYKGPVAAPVTAGQEIGALTIAVAGEVVMSAPLYADRDVPAGSIPQRARDALVDLLFGWL